MRIVCIKSEYGEINALSWPEKIKRKSGGGDGMSRLDDIKAAYDNIQVPAELKERVLQSMERGKKDACGEKRIRKNVCRKK